MPIGVVAGKMGRGTQITKKNSVSHCWTWQVREWSSLTEKKLEKWRSMSYQAMQKF